MNNIPPKSIAKTDQKTDEKKEITPLNALMGGIISGSLGVAAYKLMLAIAITYSQKPVTFTNPMAVNIASAVRTLVVGVVALAACLFGIVGLGLVALTIKLLIEKFKKSAI